MTGKLYDSSNTHKWNISMLSKKKQVSQRSLDNLKLGAEARRKDKQRHNFTLLPATVEWLKQSSNASDLIDRLVASAKAGHIYPEDTHDRKDEEVAVSNDVYERIDSLERENEQLRSQLSRQKEAVELLQKAVTSVDKGGVYKSNAAKLTKEVVEKAINLLESQSF